ncbi:MAG: LPS assembly protein LptD [Candidatus Omnitrophica bacterium]|nr:LPS assembly protein LptD [Candidatus Omnitrophota bacterium]
MRNTILNFIIFLTLIGCLCGAFCVNAIAQEKQSVPDSVVLDSVDLNEGIIEKDVNEEKTEQVFEEPKEEILVKETVKETEPDSESGFDDQVINPVEIDGDNVELMQDENKVVVDGNVSMVKGDTRLTCDRVEYYHKDKKAFAQGNVVLSNPKGQISGENLIFNFDTMTGEFSEAKIISAPYYGRGEKISKVGENHMVMTQGYITTCDLDKPHYKMKAKRIDVYPGEKAQARSLRMIIGKLPIVYFPQFTQVLNDTEPRVVYTPGYDKDWGIFLLSAWRYYFNENFKGNIHLDIREKKDFASGFDVDYKVPGYGEGLIKTYYMNERNITSDRFWDDRLDPTVERERFKAEWRHKWRIDETSNLVLQYYKLSDNEFLKDYFSREYDKDPNPETYFLFTKNLNKGIFSFRVDKRVNRFVSSVERLPEIGYDMTNQEVGNTGLYFQSRNLFSNLSYPEASPSDVRKDTIRIDSVNSLSLPRKIGFLDFTPSIGQRETFYTKTKDDSQRNIVRSIFEAGATLSTKFYKTFDVEADVWGVEIDRLRHIITPTVAYLYRNEPSFPGSKLNVFDAGIDSIESAHKIEFSLENKLQTKRDGQNVDLLRFITSTDFLLKEDPGSGSFNNIKTDLEFRPTEWLTFYSDSDYDVQEEQIVSSNFEIYVNSGDKWSFGLGKRYHVDVDDQITAQLQYVINPKWRFRVYERFDVGSGTQKEQEYTVTRDLHCWEMDISFNETRDQGSEIWMVFRLKAFPDMSIDIMSTGFNERKVGSERNL